MKSIFTILGAFLLCTSTCFAQVGIGTDTPDASSILELQSTDKGLLLPRLTTADRDLIATPAVGLTIYNTDTESLEVYISEETGWSHLSTEADATPTLTLYSANTGSIPSVNGTFYNLPVGGATSEIQENNTDYFSVISDGEIEILKPGSYIINASWSVSNLKTGSNKYILAVFLNGSRISYLSRGVATLPSGDHFGVTGTFQYYFNAGDVIDIKYYLKNDDNNSNTLSGTYTHIGITKL
ncbi:MAG: hypothetical protein ABJQ39_12775 [Winogradskyella arenosi]